MAPRVDSAAMRAAAVAVHGWVRGDDTEPPPRAAVAAAVRATARMLAQIAPGGSVEVRVPPYVAVQCIEGPRHTRGTPPNVVECDPRTWLRLATGLLEFDDAAVADLTVSGARASEVAAYLPLMRY